MEGDVMTDWKTQYRKSVSSAQTTHGFSVNSNHNRGRCVCVTDTLTQSVRGNAEPRAARAILENDRGEILLQHKAPVINTACDWHKNRHRDHGNRTEYPENEPSPGSNPNVHQQLNDKLWIFTQWSVSGEKG